MSTVINKTEQGMERLFWTAEVHRAPEGWGSHNFKKIAKWKWYGCQPYALAAFALSTYHCCSFLLEAESTTRPYVANSVYTYMQHGTYRRWFKCHIKRKGKGKVVPVNEMKAYVDVEEQRH